MLDKEVIQFTREGLVRKNLSTGETKIIIESDYAKEMKYKPADKEAQYQTPYQRTDERNPGEPSETKARKPLQSKGPNSSENPSQPTGNRTSPQTDTGPASNSAGGGSADPRAQPRYSYGRRQKGVKYYYAARSDVGNIPTTAEYRKSVRGRFSVRKRLIHYTKDRILHNREEKDDNPGVDAAENTIRTAGRFRSGIRSIRNLNQKRRFVFQTTERTAVYQRQAAAAARSASSVAGNTAAKAGNTVGKAAGLLKNPAVAKFLLLAAAIFIGLVLLCMLLGGLSESLFGSTTENPDLTNYVAQLDGDFLAKIDSIKAYYERNSNTTVTIEGDESVATDPNALAILAAGEWTMIDLTQENKEKLADAHAKLNTFTVQTKDETETETITNPDGTTSEIQKTIHRITIQVRVYTAMEKLDDFGYTDQQKKDITEQLTVLNEITADISGNTGGTEIIVGDGDFIWPLPGHTYISSGYGSRVDPITGEEGTFHTGLDIPAPTGTPVLASADGTVIFAGVNGGYGNCVIIQHANGIQTLYGHNSELVVQKGETVAQGQVIAEVGQTGRATGPHCHWEFRINGQHVDPASYLHVGEGG